MQIKKLTAAEKEEGLTLEIVNAVNFNMPFILLGSKNDEPGSVYRIIKCSTGFWIKPEPDDEESGYVKDEKNKLLVLDERTVIIARARYLMINTEKEREAAVQELLEQRKQKARKALDNIKDYIAIKNMETTSDFGEILASLGGEENKGKYLAKKELERQQLPQIQKAYKELEKLYEENKIVDILEILGVDKIRPQQFGEPMLTVSFEDKKGIADLKQMFGRQALEAPDFSMDKVYAQIEVLKKY